MVLSTVGRAGIVAVAVVDALGTPFRADKVGKREGVLGDVGLLVVAAEATVGEGVLGSVSRTAWPERIGSNSSWKPTGSQLLTNVGFVEYCWQMEGQVSCSLSHHDSVPIHSQPKESPYFADHISLTPDIQRHGVWGYIIVGSSGHDE